jgi:hypothetical protein
VGPLVALSHWVVRWRLMVLQTDTRGLAVASTY